jgi:hypothetical protein
MKGTEFNRIYFTVLTLVVLFELSPLFRATVCSTYQALRATICTVRANKAVQLLFYFISCITIIFNYIFFLSSACQFHTGTKALYIILTNYMELSPS